MNVFVFDIETVPDTQGGAGIYGLEGLSDGDIAQAMFALHRQHSGREFLPLHLHKVVSISVVFRNQQHFKVWSLGDLESTEKDLIERFYKGIEKYCPTLVSWNGSGFDLPVLHYRAMLHAISAPAYWETGEENQSFRWNNYISRYHMRHTDLMDLLALYQPKAYVRLDQMATLLGYPGKMGMSGAKVWDYYQQGQLQEIRNYCETDVLNTYLVYLHFQLMRGHLNTKNFQQELQVVQDYLEAQTDKEHMKNFLQAWCMDKPAVATVD